MKNSFKTHLCRLLSNKDINSQWQNFFNRQIVVEQLVLQLQFKAAMFWQFEVIFLTLEISFFKIVILDFKGNKILKK